MSLNPTRTIHVPGEGLLPPSAEPMVPQDIGIDEIVSVVPPQPPHFPTKEEFLELTKDPSLPLFDRRYWAMGDAAEEHPNNLQWMNDPGGTYGSGHGIANLPDVIEFRVKGKIPKRGFPDLWNLGGLLVVSTRLIDLLMEMDREAIVHKPVLIKNEANELVDDNHRVIDVVRNVWAVDFANSIIHYQGPSSLAIRFKKDVFPRPIAYPSVRILQEIDSAFQIFRQAKHPRAGGGGRSCLVTDALKRRIEAMRPKARNIHFKPLYAGL